MRSRKLEATLLKSGFSFITAQHNGLLFQRKVDGVVQGRVVRPDGTVMVMKPFKPTTKEQIQLWGR